MQVQDISKFPEYLQPLLAELPALIARREVRELTGGVVGESTMKNDDSLRRGPKQRLYMNGRVVYPRAAFVAYLATKVTAVVRIDD